MPSGDSIPGWGFSPDPATTSAAQRSIPDRLSETWQVYRSHAGLVLDLALRVQGVLGLTYAPATVALMFGIEQRWGQAGFFADDPDSTRQMLAALMPNDPVSVLMRGISPVATALVVVLLTAALALILLPDPADDEPVRPSVRTIIGRSSACWAPLAALAAGGIAFSLLEGIVLTPTPAPAQVALDVQVSDGLTGALFGIDILIIVLAVALTYALARWAVAVPVAVVERLGFRRALARSSELSRGHRMSVLLSLLVVSVATGLVLTVVALGSSLLAGTVLGSGSIGAFVLCVVATLAALIVTAPLVPIVLVILYRDLRGAADGG